jgi:putative Ca2+/H+ antiporter (TMEM165/GDT1 family)
MESTIFLSTFGLIFLAELGDKTQLTAMALALRYPWQRIFVGIAAAFGAQSGCRAGGKVLFLLLPIFWVTLVSALLFILVTAPCGMPVARMMTMRPPSGSHGLCTAFIMIHGGTGDKTQLVTASQAAQHSDSLGMSMVSCRFYPGIMAGVADSYLPANSSSGISSVLDTPDCRSYVPGFRDCRSWKLKGL